MQYSSDFNTINIVVKRITVIFAILALTASRLFCQGPEPIDLAKKIFGRDSLPGMEKYITGEYKGEPNGQNLQDGTITRFLLLQQTANKAVVAMTILDSSGKGLDTYLYFEKDKTWKMSAFRALAMTGMIEQIKEQLEKMTAQELDKIIKQSLEAKDEESKIITSKEDYDFQLGNARLTLELDDNIIKHFKENKKEFERIKELALKEMEGKNDSSERSVKLLEHNKADYRKIFISSVSYGDYELGGKGVNFSIGGILDNTVGYLYVKDKKDLPEMSADRIIMIKEIGDGWYIYKTT